MIKRGRFSGSKFIDVEVWEGSSALNGDADIDISIPGVGRILLAENSDGSIRSYGFVPDSNIQHNLEKFCGGQ